MAKKKLVVVEAVSAVKPDAFCCYYGTQPFFSSAEESLCNAVAEKRKAELVNMGVDIRVSEHAVEVREL